MSEWESVKDVSAHTSHEFDVSCIDKVRYGFFTRDGGVSQGLYRGLNCGVGSKDDPSLVAKNRARVTAYLGSGADRLIGLYQVHGDVCHVVDETMSAGSRPEGDALVCDVAGVSISVLTADCAPVLFYGEKESGAPVIGAAHAGWGGALRGVLKSTVDAMVGIGAVQKSIQACIGPCIAQKSYEVRGDFLNALIVEDAENMRFFEAVSDQGEAWHFDLRGYCAWKLSQAGVLKVYNCSQDTYTDEQHFYSYRRATHKGEADYGRQISAIMISDRN